jgi:hypothetical protein
LIVAKSSIQRDGFVKIRQQWTKALEFAFTKFDVPFEVNTGDGLAVVNVQKVSWQNREKTINELCKYVTKADSWSKIPIEQLETIVAVPRFWRMFESFGVCRQTARGMMKKTLKTSENAENECVNQGANHNEDTYIYTKNLINRPILERVKQKRVAWRIRAKEIPLWKYKMELNVEIEAVQQYRRWQLHQKYSFATFQTLDGQVF